VNEERRAERIDIGIGIGIVATPAGGNVSGESGDDRE